MKRRICFLLALGMGISLMAGCGQLKKADKEEKGESVTGTEEQAASDSAMEIFDFDVSKYVKLGEYKNLSVQYPTPAVAEEDVEYEISMLLDEHTEYNEISGRPVQNGDYVNIDYTGTLNGEEFEGGSDTGAEFVVGNGDFLEDFETNIVGKNAGETFAFKMTFPEDYEEELAGKEVEFTITVNSISETAAPEYTDAFVAEVTDFDTIAAYEESVRAELMETAKKDSEQASGEDALLLAVENSTVDGYPQELYDIFYDETVKEYQAYAEMFGMEYEEFMSEFMDEESLKEEVTDGVNELLVCKAIAEKEGFEVTDKNFEEEALVLAQEYEYESVDDYIADSGEFSVMKEIIRNKTVDFLYKNAQVEEVSEAEYYGEEEAVEDTEATE